MDSSEREFIRNPFAESYLRSAFDLSSGGMGVHLYAVAANAEAKPLESWAKASLGHYSCNYLVTPYVQVWKGDLKDKYSNSPKNLSPYSTNHLFLIKVTDQLYTRIAENRIRLVLAGSESWKPEDINTPLTTSELNAKLLPFAKNAGIIEYDSFSLDRVPYSVGTLFGSMYKAGVKINQEFDDRMDVVDESSLLESAVKTASIYKLGAQLAVTDQYTYDAYMQGVPVPANFRPPDPSGNWSNNWQRLFGKPLPTIENLYKEAFEVFKANIDANDPLARYLLSNLETLPSLAR